jgi:3,4-dihydroxy 2-butanone 4-phosphate synthase / GTP cyclohydrolase II
LLAYQDHVNRDVHLALIKGTLDGPEPPLVRVHLTDTLRDLVGVETDRRAWTLRSALQRVATHGSGVIIILREQESPRELADAVRQLGTGTMADRAPPGGRQVLRTYGIGAQILKDLGVRRMLVLSAPKQMFGISAFDLEVAGYVTD